MRRFLAIAALLALAASLSGLWDGSIASGASICAWAGVGCAAVAGQLRPTALCAARPPLRYAHPLAASP